MGSVLRLVLALGICGIAAESAGAADGRLYPSGPPNGVAYLRFANLSPAAVKVSSAGGALDLPTSDAQRVGEFDPVTPGTELTGTVAIGDRTAPIKLTLKQNEFVTVAVTAAAEGPPTVTLLREEPSDFNAQKSALALYNVDKNCAEAELLAGDRHTVVVSGVKPGATGRRLVNPVNVALSVGCGAEGGKATGVELGAMAAGDRYSVFIYAGPGSAGRQALALTDKMAPFRP
ncbi:MAG TPA: alginate O-acetyltransferase AlgF [Stellaceae bacterium]|nr:alginate O-acetyltransferase AlgF [Stellaceae bacterium]